CGLGDSVSPDPDRENDPYPATAFRDVALALEHLRAQLGVERAVLMGLCSGAYAAFQSAARLSSPMLIESVAINPLTFYWKDGMSLEAAPAKRLEAYRACLTAVFQPRKWFRVLSGRSKLGITGVLKRLLDGWRLRGRSRQTAPSIHLETPDFPFSHPL